MDERRGWMDRRGREISEGVVSGDKGYLVVELMREKVGQKWWKRVELTGRWKILVLSWWGWNRANYLQSVMDRMPLFDSRESAFLHRQTVHLRRVKLYLAWNTVPKRRRSCDAASKQHEGEFQGPVKFRADSLSNLGRCCGARGDRSEKVERKCWLPGRQIIDFYSYLFVSIWTTQKLLFS